MNIDFPISNQFDSSTQKSISNIFNNTDTICFSFLSNGKKFQLLTIFRGEREREGEIIFSKFIISERYSLHPLSQQITIYKPRYRTFYEGVGNFSGTKINGGSIVQTRSFSPCRVKVVLKSSMLLFKF